MDRCSSCPGSQRVVRGYGAPNAKVFVIAEGPGFRESERGIPMCGPSGQELDETYLPLAGLTRSEVYISQAVQCRCERNGQDVRPAESLVRTCAVNHLPEEIANVGPNIMVLLGAVACSLVPGINLDLDHGRPIRMEGVLAFGDWSGTVVPMYHPAAGMRDGRFSIYLLEDFEKFGLWLRGKLVYPSLTVKPRYQLISSRDEFWAAVKDEPEGYRHLPLDTESDEGRVWSLQFSTQPGKGFMILRDNVPVVDDFRTWLSWTYNNRLLLHNAPHDLDELDQIGIECDDFRDTMQEIYHLGNLPQGLKAAVYRTLGHRMTSYRETVTPHSRAVLDAWLCEALVWATEQRVVESHPIGPGCPSCGKKHRKDVSVYRPHEAEAVLRRVMGRLQDESSEYDPWQKPKLSHGEEKPRLLGREWLGPMEQSLGRMPRCSIIHTPLEQAVQYACGDADLTGQLGTWLEQERKRIVTEEWEVAA